MSDFWQNKIIPMLTNPVLALHGILFLVINLGLVKLLTDLIDGRRRDMTSDFIVLTSTLAQVIFVAALIVGAMAIVYGLLGKNRPEAADDEGMQDRMKRWLNDPYILLDIGIFAVIYLGLISRILFMNELRGAGPVSVWSWWATKMFYLTTGVLALLAIRAFAHHVIASATGASEGSADAKADGDSDGDDEKSEDSGAGFADRMVAHVSTWQQQMRYGVIALAYFGAIFIVLDMWDFRDFRPNGIWWNYFWSMSLVLGGIGAILLLTRLLEVVTHSEQDDPDDRSESMANRMAAKFKDPGRMSLMVFFAMAAVAGAWGLINIWLTRNEGALDFWAEVMWTLHIIVPAIGVPFVFWSMWQVITSPQARSSGTLLYDPYRQMTILIYLVAYLGMVDFVFHGWIYRDANPAFIWETVGEDLFNVVARVGIFVALRAIVAALVMGSNPEAVNASPEPAKSEEAEPEPA